MKTLQITHDAVKFTATLPPKQFRQVFTAVLALLGNSQPHDSKPLKGSDTLWRIDVGEYRVVYEHDDATVRVMVIGKRNDGAVYRKL